MLLLPALLSLILSQVPEPAPATKPPNILFLLADDLGFGDLTSYGNQVAPTPHLDRLAAEGTRFTQFYVASPICSPSRVGFLTGMFPASWRINSYLQSRAGNRVTEQADWIDPTAPSLARQLQAAGYATAHVGKWHLGGGRDVDDAPLPSAYGFDESLVNSTPLEGMGPALPDGTPRWQTTELFVDAALDFIRRHPDKPFFVNLWFSEVHDAHIPRPEASEEDRPQDARKKGQSLNTPANFRKVLTGFDAQIGRLLRGLREAGRENDTLLIFAGDNGPQPLYDGLRRAGLRGQKWSLYEGGIRVPLIIRWPGHIPAGQVNEQTVMGAVDFLPTLCQLTNTPLPSSYQPAGEDLSVAWLGDKPLRTRPLLWEYRRSDVYLRPSDPHDLSPSVAIRDGRWKLLVNADGTGLELYDLADDTGESQNLAHQEADIARRLSEQALSWRRSLP